MIASLHRAVTGHTDARPLAIVRVLVGGAALGKIFDFRHTLAGVLDPASVRVPQAAWVPDLPPRAIPWFVAFWVVAALAFTIGWKTRMAGAALTAVLVYIILLDQQLYTNHHYMLTVVVFLLTISDSGARASLDARRHGPRELISAWPVHLLKTHLSVVYGFAAIAKLNLTFLSGSVLASTYGMIAIPEAWRIQQVMLPLAAVSLLAELFLAFALWSPRLRKVALLVGFAFHTVIVLTAGDVVMLGIFATVTLSLYALFFDEWPWTSKGSIDVDPRVKQARLWDDTADVVAS